MGAAVVLAWRAWVRRERGHHVGQGACGPRPEASYSAGQDRRNVILTRNSTPVGETHWRCRWTAEKAGMSQDIVQRIGATRGLSRQWLPMVPVLTGKVVRSCLPKHRHQEFLCPWTTTPPTNTPTSIPGPPRIPDATGISP